MRFLISKLKGFFKGGREAEFRIKLHGRDCFLYSENGRDLIVTGEMLAGPVDFTIYKSSVTNWEPPFTSEPISEEKKHEVLKRLTDWMDSKGIKYDLQE